MWIPICRTSKAQMMAVSKQFYLDSWLAKLTAFYQQLSSTSKVVEARIEQH